MFEVDRLDMSGVFMVKVANQVMDTYLRDGVMEGRTEKLHCET
jgi:hypothetical protein